MTLEQKASLLKAWRDIAKEMGASNIDVAHIAAVVLESIVFKQAEGPEDAMEGVDALARDIKKNLAKRYRERNDA